jgi:hypothetical protein
MEKSKTYVVCVIRYQVLVAVNYYFNPLKTKINTSYIKKLVDTE